MLVTLSNVFALLFVSDVSSAPAEFPDVSSS